MKIDTKNNQVVLTEVYNTIVLKTKEDKKLYICMRDYGYEIKLDNGDWHMIEKESDFKIVNRTNKTDMRDGSYTC